MHNAYYLLLCEVVRLLGRLLTTHSVIRYLMKERHESLFLIYLNLDVFNKVLLLIIFYSNLNYNINSDIHLEYLIVKKIKFYFYNLFIFKPRRVRNKYIQTKEIFIVGIRALFYEVVNSACLY